MSIHQYFPTTLSRDQQQAIQRIEAFLAGKTPVFLLKGYAGTGKTFLLEGLVRYFKQNNRAFRLMAPTGRAAMVISEKAGAEAATIHRGIYNLENLLEDETTFKLMYQLKDNVDSLSTVYIVDEASMVGNVHQEDEFFQFGSGHLLDDLIRYIRFSDRKDAKLLFIGDHAQLPPVGMNFSPALEANYLRENYQLDTEEYELTEVQRQHRESGILANATALRETLIKQQFNRFEISDRFPDVTVLKPLDFTSTYRNTALGKNPDQTLIVTHSNRKALQYNKMIRAERFPGKTNIQPGDWVLSTRNNYNYFHDIYNGQFAQVLEVDPQVESKTVPFYIKGGEKITRHLTFRNVVLAFLPGHPVKCKILDDFLTEVEGRLSPYDQRALYIDFKERARKQGLIPQTEPYRAALSSDPYFNALQIKYGYAVTCHKSQGGEWPQVFVDFDVMIGAHSSTFYRWAYTAITRSNGHLFTVGAKNYSPLSEFIIHPVQRLSESFPRQAYYVPSVEEMAPGIRPNPFLQWRYRRIMEIMSEQDIAVHLIQADWIEKYAFTREGQQVEIWLYYNKDFFTGKYDIRSESNPSLSSLVLDLLDRSLVHTPIPFSADQAFQQELHDYLTEILREEQVWITNIHLSQWKDVYYFRTEKSIVSLEFYYGQKGIYTALIPKSTLGDEDEAFQRILDRLAGNG